MGHYYHYQLSSTGRMKSFGPSLALKDRYHGSQGFPIRVCWAFVWAMFTEKFPTQERRPWISLNPRCSRWLNVFQHHWLRLCLARGSDVFNHPLQWRIQQILGRSTVSQSIWKPTQPDHWCCYFALQFFGTITHYQLNCDQSRKPVVGEGINCYADHLS